MSNNKQRRKDLLAFYVENPNGMVFGIDDRLVTYMHNERLLEYDMARSTASVYKEELLYGFMVAIVGDGVIPVVGRFYTDRSQRGWVDLYKHLAEIHAKRYNKRVNDIHISGDYVEAMGTIKVSDCGEFIPISYLPYKGLDGFSK